MLTEPPAQSRIFECVPNVSVGRDHSLVAQFALACGPSLLDKHFDPDHDRSVFTLAALSIDPLQAAVRSLALAVAESVDLRQHGGVHPRIGALDVVPFVALSESDRDQAEAVEAARSFGDWIASTLHVPVFLYDQADRLGRTLPSVRAECFRGRSPDFGPNSPHRTLGAVAVGARRPLVALNCILNTGKLAVAQSIAHEIRERDGGLVGVRALGLYLEGRGVAQVSMNLVDLSQTGVTEVIEGVEVLAALNGVMIDEIELVGLIPQSERGRWSEAFQQRCGIGEDRTVEWCLSRQREH